MAGRHWRRAGRGNYKTAGLLVFLAGCGVLAYTLPGWAWLVVVGGGLVWAGWYLMSRA
ncbi:MAG: hypothetical protein AB1445_03545 [Bacillota bacterium]